MMEIRIAEEKVNKKIKKRKTREKRGTKNKREEKRKSVNKKYIKKIKPSGGKNEKEKRKQIRK